GRIDVGVETHANHAIEHLLGGRSGHTHRAVEAGDAAEGRIEWLSCERQRQHAGADAGKDPRSSLGALVHRSRTRMLAPILVMVRVKTMTTKAISASAIHWPRRLRAFDCSGVRRTVSPVGTASWVSKITPAMPSRGLAGGVSGSPSHPWI